ncbi:MAG: DUF2232 domain-containing protein [Spirochaetes bacterium]|nr:DUF2232 domain-containing protein [Spirochaetota bacterium]
MIAVFAALAGGIMLTIGAAYMYYRLEWKAVIICAILVGTSMAVSGRAIDAPLLTAPFLVGCLAGYVFKKGKSFEFYLITISFALTAIFAGFFYYMMIVQNVDFIGMLREEMARFLASTGAPDDIRNGMLSEFDSSRNDIVARVPFSAFINSMAMAGIAYMMIRWVFSRMGQAVRGAGLEFFRLNDYFIFVLIGGLSVFLLVDKSDYPMLSSGGLNALLIAALLYLVQALGVIKFILIKRGIPTYVMPLAITAFMIAGLWTALFLFILLAGFGALDVWADFRKLVGKKEPEG